MVQTGTANLPGNHLVPFSIMRIILQQPWDLDPPTGKCWDKIHAELDLTGLMMNLSVCWSGGLSPIHWASQAKRLTPLELVSISA